MTGRYGLEEVDGKKEEKEKERNGLKYRRSSRWIGGSANKAPGSSQCSGRWHELERSRCRERERGEWQVPSLQ